jgi:hypothetical protein
MATTRSEKKRSVDFPGERKIENITVMRLKKTKKSVGVSFPKKKTSKISPVFEKKKEFVPKSK